MKSISNIFAIFFSCMLGIISQIEAQEEQPRQLNEQQQEEEKDIPVIMNPTIFDEKDFDKLLEKQREYVKKHYQIIKSGLKESIQIILMVIDIHFLICKTKMRNGS